ncbi:acyl-CoA dehydrogenase NM domain-like protein [Schizopora paradoxa]|uniref:Acyl-CoA dehydrogenase NM domain-like protein n=1 Tax=Schizopora paradoxa TaxID=27342 RepID=A0A0H2RC31_9AGAM|nr:acyl-CoA dehydrogenase NM domain-like protein [Schizopora paradoxa]
MFAASTLRTRHLMDTPLFNFEPHKIGMQFDIQNERKKIYERAREIARVYNFTLHDVTTLSPKFWELAADFIGAIDASTTILLTIQYNLAAGTLAPFVDQRPELRPLMARILKFDISAQFLLTELAHGIDAKNLETTAALLPSGEFDLHTPRFEASKFMPPNAAIEGWDRVGFVIARLMVNGEDRGVRPFIVMLSLNGKLCNGITSRILPSRPGTGALDHAITSFNHVRLPPSALLGTTEIPEDPRASFASCIQRVHIGSISLSLSAISAVSLSAFIAAKYSMQRTVTMYSNSGEAIATPIWTFRTQQIPILTCFARHAVMKAFAKEAISLFVDPNLDPRAQFGIASERCGAQGLYLHNQIYCLALQGGVIAEGDALALSIRAATDLFLGRYTLSTPRYPHSPLAQYEKYLYERCESILSEAGSDRSDILNRRILPLCRPLIEAISHRMAYEAALDSEEVHKPLLDLYEITIIRKYGTAWFASRSELGLSPERQEEMEEVAVSAAAPFIERYMAESGAEPFAKAPMLSKERFREFAESLETFQGASDIGTASLSTNPSLKSKL